MSFAKRFGILQSIIIQVNLLSYWNVYVANLTDMVSQLGGWVACYKFN